MKSTFKILFYARKNQVNKNGEVGIMVRISMNGETTQFSSKLTVDPNLWDTRGNKVIGRSAQSNQLNTILDSIKASLFFHYREIERHESFVTAEKIRNAFLGVTVKEQMLLVVFKKHNEDLSKRIGKGISESGVGRYELTKNRLANFMEDQYNINDIALKEINYTFITGFETYLRVNCDCSINTTAKFIQQFKRIIILAKNNGWISADPFVNYKIRLEKVERGYLTQEELNMIMQKRFAIQRIEQVRDIFVFSCFTGLAYVDVKNLKEKDVKTSFDGKLWIMKKRQKTGIQSNILLLDIPKNILKKYKGELPNENVLPVLSNQKMNSYLKEIADLCGIDQNLTFHLARHTFATTVTLSKGVPIETVSKMLGHSNIKTTQIYAKITNDKISHDMHELSEKLKGMDKMLTL
jgi:site-specific recombinase XerD